MKRDFSLLYNRPFDLLVCGGGIYGAWTAYDAALRGLNVAIVEQADWACATSSCSSKLIHGGLRYLETCNFRLVKKALRERQMLLEAAPHRVWPLRFGVPVYEDSRIGTVQLMAGLTLYDFLGGSIHTEQSHRHFDTPAFAARFPFLDPENLQGGFTYADAQTDDARLVLELIDGAMTAGAVCVNYCKLTGLIESNDQSHGETLVRGATVEDQLDGAIAEIIAKQIVNATGRWTAATPQGRDWCRLTKGVHLLLPAVQSEEALLLTAKSDGRVFFMIPWYGLSLIGTTDTDYPGDINHVAVEKSDVTYLLAEANHYFKTAWKETDIIGSYAGLRVMKHDDKSSPSSASREWELKTASNGVHYSVGGKITSARKDAARIVNEVCSRLGINAQCPTKGKKFPWVPEENYSSWLFTETAQAGQLGVDEESAKWLMRRHGKRVAEIFRIIESQPRMAERILPGLPFIHADLLWSARNEMAVHLSDLLRRRMPLLILAKLDENDLRRIAASVSNTLGWDEARLKQEIDSCR
jgi:glycerol-3-phosphate dehydrogenase